MSITKLFHIQTFGCQMNVSDSEKVAALLKKEGYLPTENAADADLIILNTCNVRAKAETKVYRTLENMKPLKKAKKNLVIGVAGCVAQQEGQQLLDRVPYLDLVFGTHSVYMVPELVKAAQQGKRQVAVDFADEETSRNLFPDVVDAGGVSRFITIMQGCDNFCSYCIVPYVRGREISRPPAEIVKEVREAADKGVKEVTLLGQNVNSYGKKEAGIDFAELLRQVATVEGINRIRFTTSHPKDLSPELVACFAEIPKLCGHIHLPAQSGSDKILAQMNRGYTREAYLAKTAALRSARPDIMITSDIIVGFPGETDADFDETMSLIEEVDYADLFSFIYSPRPGTGAADMPDQISREVKQVRLDRIIAHQRGATMSLHEKLVGTVQEIMIDGRGKLEGQISGRLEGNRIVNLQGPSSLMGSLIKVKITKAFQNSLLGEMV